MKNEKTITIGLCEVTVGFAEKSNDAKNKALWIILENFKQRTKESQIPVDEGAGMYGEYCV